MEERFQLINRRLALLEHQVRVLSDALGVACPTFASDADTGVQMHLGRVAATPAPTAPEAPAAVVALVRAGKRIDQSTP